MSKRITVLSAFFLVLILASGVAKAAVVEVDVTVKAVDVKARGITVTYETKLGQKSIDLDVSRKAEITVNGESGTLDSVKPGQKAKVTFEKELQVVTKIVTTGKGTEPGREVYRFLLSISESGDCTVKVEQTTAPISSVTKFAGKPMKLTRLPNAEVLKASDGRFSIVHSFDKPDPLTTAFSMIRNVELSKSDGAVAFRPKKGEQSGVAYWSTVKLPAVICYDRGSMQSNSGLVLQIQMTPELGMLGVNLGQDKNGKAFTAVYWIDLKDGKPGDRTQILDPKPFDIAEGCERKFRLPLPNVRIEENCSVWLEAWGDENGRSDLLHLMIQGEVHPGLGIKLGERTGRFFAKAVIPGGLAEKAGIEEGDVLLSFNGEQPKSLNNAVMLCRKWTIGDTVRVKVRRGNEERELTVTIE